MMCHWSRLRALSIGLLLPALMPAAVTGAQLDSAVQVQQERLESARRSQATVEKLDDQQQKMLSEYREAIRELENLKSYHTQLAKIVDSQDKEVAELDRQMDEIDETQRNIIPLMQRMQAVLRKFVELDAPFLEQERTLRVEELEHLLDRSDVDLAEKLHRLIDAYLVETDYGRTIEAYSGELPMGGGNRTVEFLRFGRVGLYYLTLDGNECGYWDKENKEWRILPSEYRTAIGQSLRVAKKQAAPELLKLPVSAPETAR